MCERCDLTDAQIEVAFDKVKDLLGKNATSAPTIALVAFIMRELEAQPDTFEDQSKQIRRWIRNNLEVSFRKM